MPQADPLIDVVLIARDCPRELEQCFSRIPRRGLRSLIVVDNGSSDDTWQVGRDQGATVLHSPQGGYGTACRVAMLHLQSLPVQPHTVVFFDVLGSEDLADIECLLAPINTNNAELVLATRRSEKTRLGERAMLGLIGVVYGHSFSELSGLCAVRYAALVALGLSATDSGWNVEMMVKAVRLGLRILEVPVASLASPPVAPKRKWDTSRKFYRILRHAAAR